MVEVWRASAVTASRDAGLAVDEKCERRVVTKGLVIGVGNVVGASVDGRGVVCRVGMVVVKSGDVRVAVIVVDRNCLWTVVVVVGAN